MTLPWSIPKIHLQRHSQQNIASFIIFVALPVSNAIFKVEINKKLFKDIYAGRSIQLCLSLLSIDPNETLLINTNKINEKFSENRRQHL